MLTVLSSTRGLTIVGLAFLALAGCAEGQSCPRGVSGDQQTPTDPAFQALVLRIARRSTSVVLEAYRNGAGIGASSRTAVDILRSRDSSSLRQEFFGGASASDTLALALSELMRGTHAGVPEETAEVSAFLYSLFALPPGPAERLAGAGIESWRVRERALRTLSALPSESAGVIAASVVVCDVSRRMRQPTSPELLHSDALNEDEFDTLVRALALLDASREHYGPIHLREMVDLDGPVARLIRRDYPSLW